jgi:hypothetical protein
VRKLAEVLKLPVAFFYSDTDDEVASLLLSYALASSEIKKQAIQILESRL